MVHPDKRRQSMLLIWLVCLAAWTLHAYGCGDTTPPQETGQEASNEASNEASHDASTESQPQESTAETTQEPPAPRESTTETPGAEPSPEPSTPDEPGSSDTVAPDASTPDDATPDASPGDTSTPEPGPTDAVGDAAPPEMTAPKKPIWLGVGNFGLRAYTFDGVTWAKQGGTGSGNQHTPDLLRSVDYGDGVFVAVGGNNNSQIMRSADGGKTWKQVGFATGGWLGGVVYANGTWFAAKGYSAHVLRSDDKGLTWTPVDMSKSQVKRSSGIRNMSAYQGKILAFGDKGSLYVSHDKGVSWLDHSTPMLTSGVSFVVHFKGLWYAGGGSQCITSTDLKAWKKCSFTIKNIYSGIVSGGQFTIYHNDRYDTRFTYTTDGKTWVNGKTAVYSAYEADGLWIGMRYGAVYTGPSVDKLKKQSASPGGFRDWVVGQASP